MKKEKSIFSRALMIFLMMMVICGLLYTFVMTGISQLLFGKKADGSIIEVGGVKYGSELLAQQYNDESHMWGRIMNVDVSTYTDDEGNQLMYAGPSNISPASEDYKAQVEERVKMMKETNPDADMEKIPVELVTNSGSGLDPHISPAAAEYQVPRIAKENDLSEEEVKEIIKRYTDGKLFGILGEETVNVLKVNLALDGILEE